MKKAKGTNTLMGHWSLDVESINSWCGPKLLKKNMTCNLSKYAYASVIEEQIVTEYREDMFEEIPETATLHWATALVLTKIIVKKQNKAPMLGLSVFTFMDGIDAPHVTQTHTNVEPYIDKRHTWTAFLHYHKETQDIIQVVKRKDVVVAIPGRKTTAVAVHNKINELIEVSRMSILLPLIIQQAYKGVKYTSGHTSQNGGLRGCSRGY